MEIKIQTSQPVPGQQNISKQGSPVETPAIVVSEAKKVSLYDEQASTDEPLKNKLSEIQDKVSQLNDHMQTLKRNLQFTVDERSGSSVITIRDTETEEVLRQFPSDEVLNARSAINEQMKGLLIETKA